MNKVNKIYCPGRTDWREWLKKNAHKEKEVWLIYFKKHTDKPRVSYDDAVEEAICFGWIDSIVKRIDNESYMQKFTPRNMGSNWSKHNVNRANKMIRKGKITKQGLDLFEEWKSKNKPPVTPATKAVVPEPPMELIQALNKNPEALKNFHQLAPSYKKLYLRWICDAKKEETKLRRINKAVELLEKNIKSFM